MITIWMEYRTNLSSDKLEPALFCKHVHISIMKGREAGQNKRCMVFYQQNRTEMMQDAGLCVQKYSDTEPCFIFWAYSKTVKGMKQYENHI